MAENYVICKVMPNEAIPSLVATYCTFNMAYPKEYENVFGLLEIIFGLPSTSVKIDDELQCILSRIM